MFDWLIDCGRRKENETNKKKVKVSNLSNYVFQLSNIIDHLSVENVCVMVCIVNMQYRASFVSSSCFFFCFLKVARRSVQKTSTCIKSG